MKRENCSCECSDIKHEIRAEIQSYKECLEDGNKKLKELQKKLDQTKERLEDMRCSLLKVVEGYTEAAEKDFVMHRRQYCLLSDQIDKLYYFFFVNSGCILLITVPGSIRFIASFFK